MNSDQSTAGQSYPGSDGSAPVAVYQGNSLSRAGVRSCYNCTHQKKSVWEQPCHECLGSPVSHRKNFEAKEPNAGLKGANGATAE